MKKLFKYIKLAAVVGVVAIIGILAAYAYQPIKHVNAAEDNVIPLTNACDSVDRQCDNDPPNSCVDPQTQDCLEGCSRNSDEVCVESEQPPADDNDTPPQVLGASTTADPATVVGK